MSKQERQQKCIHTCKIQFSKIYKKILICWKHFDQKRDFTSQVDLDDREESNDIGFGRLKKGTIPTHNLPGNLGELTLGTSVDLNQKTPNDYEKIGKNLEKSENPVINVQEYSTRNIYKD